MEEQVKQLADKAWNKFQTLDASKRYLVALAGIPGSGKTTTAASIVQHINQQHHHALHAKSITFAVHRTASQPDIAVVVPMDGFHLTRAQLSALPNPEEAHYRRGAAFTFDAEAYLALVTQLRSPLEAASRTITAPSFDHRIRDPVAHDIHIPPTARIVVLEGLYTAFDRDTWRDAAHLMDEIWFIDTPVSLATERLAKRNFAAGLSPTYEAAVDRTEKNDMRNGREILAECVPVDEVIRSIEDRTWMAQVPDPDAAAATLNGGGHPPHYHSEGSPNREEGLEEEEEEEEVSPCETTTSGSSGSSSGGSDGSPARPGLKPRMDSIAELAAMGAGM